MIGSATPRTTAARGSLHTVLSRPTCSSTTPCAPPHTRVMPVVRGTTDPPPRAPGLWLAPTNRPGPACRRTRPSEGGQHPLGLCLPCKCPLALRACNAGGESQQDAHAGRHTAVQGWKPVEQIVVSRYSTCQVAQGRSLQPALDGKVCRRPHVRSQCAHGCQRVDTVNLTMCEGTLGHQT